MTFQHLLDALKLTQLNYPRALRTESNNLFELLQSAGTRQVHREWGNQELAALFKEANGNLSAEIPCKHCGQKRT